MKLNEESNQKLRDYILEMLEADKDKLHTRVELDPELLEELLFLKVKANECLPKSLIPEEMKEEVIKFPIWTGPFLSHLDLSQISYDDVFWNLTPLVNYKDGKYLDRGKNTDIYMCNTNANINFSSISRKFNRIYKDKPVEGCYLYNCTFNGTDLISSTLTGNIVMNNHCSFQDTGINIDFDFQKDEIQTKAFVERIKRGDYRGCFINGKLLDTDEELKIKIMEEYRTMEQEYRQSIEEAFQKAKR